MARSSLLLVQQLVAIGNPAQAQCREISHLSSPDSDWAGVRAWYGSCSSTRGHFNHKGEITMRKILLASALAMALAAGAPAISSASVIFNVNQTIGAGGVTGTITTDGTLGALAAANLVDWALTLNDGASTFLLNSANSEVGFILGKALSETASQLLFDA